MSKKFVEPGDTLPLTAPSGGVVSGTPYLIGSVFGVAQTTQDEDEEFPLMVVGVHILPKQTGVTFAEGDPAYWDDGAGNIDTTTTHPVVGVVTKDAASGDTEVWVRLSQPTIENPTVFGTRVDVLEAQNGIVFADTNAGVGDQVNMTTTAAHPFTEKCSVPAATAEADDFLNIDGSVWVDDQDSNPQITVEVLVGSTVVDTLVIATAADNDYVAFHERIKLTAVGASLTGEVTSSGMIKDGTVTQRGAVQKALAITASSTAGFDVTVQATSNAGHADNKATLRTISISLERGTA